MPISKTQIILSEFLLYFLNLNQFLKNVQKKKKILRASIFRKSRSATLFDSQQ